MRRHLCAWRWRSNRLPLGTPCIRRLIGRDVRSTNKHVMETNTELTILGTAIGSAKLIERILGPTADYIGGGVEAWTKKRVENVARIFRSEQRKLGSRLESEGTVPPRVLKEILQEGSFCDEELSAEYF